MVNKLRDFKNSKIYSKPVVGGSCNYDYYTSRNSRNSKQPKAKTVCFHFNISRCFLDIKMTRNF